jgi:phenylpropionate dioxygenase-like ring-hydroxylating dioxygenase large terminal subunit
LANVNVRHPFPSLHFPVLLATFVNQSRLNVSQTISIHSKRACVTAFPTAEAQGLLFVYPGNPENAPKVSVPVVQPLEENPDDW